MLTKGCAIVLLVAFSLVAGEDPAWKTKPIPEWTADEAQQVLTDSPWAKTVTPTVNRQSGEREPGSGGGRRGGIGIGLPGGMGRRYPGGGGYPGGGRPDRTDGSTTRPTPPTLKLRWESALPIREAELKARDTNAPTLAEDSYAIAVYGVPRRMATTDSKTLSDQLKRAASLKRDGKKDLKPSSVEVLEREDGPVIVYLFPRSHEIPAGDRRVEFDARIGRLDFTQSFYLEDMVFQGKLEL